jgi:hypothetical protein
MAGLVDVPGGLKTDLWSDDRCKRSNGRRERRFVRDFVAKVAARSSEKEPSVPRNLPQHQRIRRTILDRYSA